MPHYLSFYRIIRPSGYDWTIFVDQPVLLLNLEIFLFIPASIVFFLLIILIVTIIFCIFSCGMSLDMNLIIKQAKKVQTLDLENKIFRRPKSLFSEMRELQTIFLKMIDMLKELKPFIPPYIIAKIQTKDRAEEAPAPKVIENNKKSNAILPVNASMDGRMSSKFSVGSGKTSATKDSRSTMTRKMNILTSGFEQKKATIVFTFFFPYFFLIFFAKFLLHVKVCMSLSNFASRLSVESFGEIESTHSQVLTMVQTTVLATKGFMVKTDIFSFNFMFSAPSQIRDAMSCISQIKEKLRDFNLKNKDKLQVFVHCGIAQSYCFLGNIGNKSFLQFCVIGDAVEESENLAAGCQNIFSLNENAILVTEFIAHETDTSYLYRSLGTWKIRKNSSLSDELVFEGEGDTIITEFLVFKLEEERKDGSDLEWFVSFFFRSKFKITHHSLFFFI